MDIDSKIGNVEMKRISAQEYTNPISKMPNTTRKVKNGLSTEFDNLLNASIKINDEPISNNDNHKVHKIAKDGLDYYFSRFRVNGKDYIGVLNVELNGNKKTLYDVNNIHTPSEYKKMAENGKLDKASTISIQPFLGDKISQTDQSVKSDAPLVSSSFGSFYKKLDL